MSTMRSLYVKSSNLCKSVIQTNYDINKAHGGELKVELLPDGEPGSAFNIQIPITADKPVKP